MAADSYSNSEHKKLQQLSHLLTKENKIEAVEGVLATDLAKGLFSKAPSDFIEAHTLEELAHITAKMMGLCDSYLISESSIRIDSELQGQSGTIRIALSDRPFIVNTIQECFLGIGRTLEVLLHPIIFLSNGRRLSLHYIEVESVTNHELIQIKNQLESALSDLILATDDYYPMLAQLDAQARSYEDTRKQFSYPIEERKEFAEFLRWLMNDGFVVLGTNERRCTLDGTNQQVILETDSIESRGITRSSSEYIKNSLHEIETRISELVALDQMMLFCELSSLSPLHRRGHLILIALKSFGSDGSLSGILNVFGLLTSRAKLQEASQIPLIRRKIKRIVDLEELIPNSHDYKNLWNIVDCLPKEQLLTLSIEELRSDVNVIRASQRRLDTRVSVRTDASHHSTQVMVALPRMRFHEKLRSKIDNLLQSFFGARPDPFAVRIGNIGNLVTIFHFRIPDNSSSISELEVEKLEQKIRTLSTAWVDQLETLIKEIKPDSEGIELTLKYKHAFSDEYQAIYTPNNALSDILVSETLSPSNPMTFSIHQHAGTEEGLYSLLLYNLDTPVTISHAFPILEHAGLVLVNEETCCIRPQSDNLVYIHRFLVRPRNSALIDITHFTTHVAPGLVEIFSTNVADDRLNSLLLTASLSPQAVAALRTYCAFLWQLTTFASRSVIQEALCSNPTIANLLWNLFEIRFNPATKSTTEARTTRFNATLNSFRSALREVSDITFDRILRILANLIESTVRTNFYTNSDTIGIKVRCDLVEIMPQPKPFMEIFVYSNRLEGIHLRGGKVARGGIRWSDRSEDYRSEVLGLMRTQKIKNAVIVPTGAKGGFVIKNSGAIGDSLIDIAKKSYSQFIRTLLSLTDNLVGDAVVEPRDLIIYDDPDPYLVVAADKGTATFSDIANQIAVDEFNFWLGDAFASGGSNGYDHKKYAITAGGAWKSVERHFNDLGIDIVSEPFTVIGVGDMSGDVFGNGLLLSKQIKLIAAFNHNHIFIDPNPDTERSFKERKRLFDMPRSGWNDYSTELLSKGGGIFRRFEKEIRVSDEMRICLGIDENVGEVVNGEQLISLILKAPADLLWNGGIGTYVKASSESNADVNDGTNDSVRINGNQLRVRVVGEGGNLGLTQLARLEFSAAGGRCNTDAVDNSGGVDLSDHEVNFKILLARLVQEGKLSQNSRNELLRDMAESACQSVLKDNRDQALLITLGSTRSSKRMNYFKSVMRDLTRLGLLNRTLEHLPDDEELGRRTNRKQGLLRPELAVITSSMKMYLKEVIRTSPIISDPIGVEYLMEYFPKELRNSFADEILKHPLKAEIISTQISNHVVNEMGVTFVPRLVEAHNVKASQIVENLLACERIIGAREIRIALRTLDCAKTCSTFLGGLQLVNRSLNKASSWAINQLIEGCGPGELVKMFKDSFTQLVASPELVLSSAEVETLNRTTQGWIDVGLDLSSANRLSVLSHVLPVLYCLSAANVCKREVVDVARIYRVLVEELYLDRIFSREDSIEQVSSWDSELLGASLSSLRNSLNLLLAKYLNNHENNPEKIVKVLRLDEKLNKVAHQLRELREDIPSVAAVAVIAREFEVIEEGV